MGPDHQRFGTRIGAVPGARHQALETGNGAYTLYAFAFDPEGNSSSLGSRTINVDSNTFAGAETVRVVVR